MTLLSVPTLADGVAGWATWLGFVGSTVAQYVFPTLGVLGLVTCTALLYAEARARRRSTAPVASLPSQGHERSRERDARSPGTALRLEPELRALLSLGRGVTDSYRMGSGSQLADEAQRNEHVRWTRDVVTVLRRCDEPVAERFESAGNHEQRMAVLADILGIEGPG